MFDNKRVLARLCSGFPYGIPSDCSLFIIMKFPSFLIIASFVLCAALAHAAGKPGNPSPGNSHKTTRVDFDKPNNGWGNGDQDAPGNSGGNNNAENGPRTTPPPGNPGGNNGWGNGNQSAPGNSAANNNAENGPKSPTPNTVAASTPSTAATPPVAAKATTVVARRVK